MVMWLPLTYFLVIIYFIIIQSSSKILTRRDNLFLLYLINLIKNSLLCDQNSHFFDPRYKGQLISKKIVRPRILQKNERMNECDVFSFIFLKNPRPEKTFRGYLIFRETCKQRTANCFDLEHIFKTKQLRSVNKY